MDTRFFCDRCPKEVKNKHELVRVDITSTTGTEQIGFTKQKELCHKCEVDLENFLAPLAQAG